MNVYEREIKEYSGLNRIAKKNSTVLLGSTFAKNIPVSELSLSYGMNNDIYNRSITDLSVFDASTVIEYCIKEMQPRKILIQLGETDLARGYKTIDEIITAYKSLVLKIKNSLPFCEIILISVCNCEMPIHPEILNQALSRMASELKCIYADISSSELNNEPYIRAFEMLKPYIRNVNISFVDAMNMIYI